MQPENCKLDDWIKVINNIFPLLGKKAGKLTEHEIICKIITNNIPKFWERDWILKDDGQAKMIKSVKKILKILKKVYATGKKEPSNKKVKEAATNTTKNNMYHLNGHNYLWKDCPNNPNSEKYNETRDS